MKAIIAAARTEEEVNAIWTEFSMRTDVNIFYADITETKITIVYEIIPVEQEIEPAQETKIKKERKQPTVKQLKEKAESFSLISEKASGKRICLSCGP